MRPHPGKAGEQISKVVDSAQLFPCFPIGNLLPTLELFPHADQCSLQERELFPRRQALASGRLGKPVSGSQSKRWFWKYRKDGREGLHGTGQLPGRGSDGCTEARDGATSQKAAGVGLVQGARRDGDTFKAEALEWHGK